MRIRRPWSPVRLRAEAIRVSSIQSALMSATSVAAFYTPQQGRRSCCAEEIGDGFIYVRLNCLAQTIMVIPRLILSRNGAINSRLSILKALFFRRHSVRSIRLFRRRTLNRDRRKELDLSGGSIYRIGRDAAWIWISLAGRLSFAIRVEIHRRSPLPSWSLVVRREPLIRQGSLSTLSSYRIR